MPAIFHNTPGAVLYFLIICVEAVTGSLFILFPLLPFMVLHPVLYRKCVDHLMMLALGLPLALLEFMFDVKVITSGDLLLPKERTLIIMNHRTMFDWLFFFQVLMHHASVKTEKIILKRGPCIVPGFGWAMQMGNYIFLARKWEKDKPWMEYCFNYYKDLKYGGQYLLFPEGTDFCDASKQRSDSYADKNGLCRYNYVLHPRTTGFAFIVKYLKDAKLIDSVMDITVGYPDLIPTKFDPFSGLFPREVQFNMQRYQVSEFPEEAEKIEQWCIDRWAEKEKYLETFYTEKKSLAEIIGKARENKKPGRHHANNVLQNGKDSPFVDNVPSKQEQNGNSIKPAEEAGTALPSKFRQTLAHTLTKNLVGIYFFWGVFTVYAAVSLYYAPVICFQCFIALVVFLLAYFVGGFDWYQLMSYNWLKRSKILPQLSLKKLK